MDINQVAPGETFAGVVEGGQILLNGNVRLPEKTKVLVVVEDRDIGAIHCSRTPCLANKDQESDFRMVIVEKGPDAGV